MLTGGRLKRHQVLPNQLARREDTLISSAVSSPAISSLCFQDDEARDRCPAWLQDVAVRGSLLRSCGSGEDGHVSELRRFVPDSSAGEIGRDVLWALADRVTALSPPGLSCASQPSNGARCRSAGYSTRAAATARALMPKSALSEVDCDADETISDSLEDCNASSRGHLLLLPSRRVCRHMRQAFPAPSAWGILAEDVIISPPSPAEHPRASRCWDASRRPQRARSQQSVSADYDDALPDRSASSGSTAQGVSFDVLRSCLQPLHGPGERALEEKNSGPRPAEDSGFSPSLSSSARDVVEPDANPPLRHRQGDVSLDQFSALEDDRGEAPEAVDPRTALASSNALLAHSDAPPARSRSVSSSATSTIAPGARTPSPAPSADGASYWELAPEVPEPPPEPPSAPEPRRPPSRAHARGYPSGAASNPTTAPRRSRPSLLSSSGGEKASGVHVLGDPVW